MCVSPLMIKKDMEKYGACDYNRVPCGTCPECHQSKVDEWKFRFKYELRDAVAPLFITLTYNNENLFYTLDRQPTLHKRDVQLFIKRLRKAHSMVSSLKLRYLAVGEYGSKRGRPHYHVCLLNLEPQFRYLIARAWTRTCHVTKKSWSIGRIDIKGLYSVGAANYVMKYMNKQSPHLRKNDLRSKEFKVASINFGLSYLTPTIMAYHRAAVENCYITHPNGYKMSMPRWYKTKVYNAESSIKYWEVSEYLEQRAHDKNVEVIKDVMVKSRMTYEDAIEFVTNRRKEKAKIMDYPKKLVETY